MKYFAAFIFSLSRWYLLRDFSSSSLLLFDLVRGGWFERPFYNVMLVRDPDIMHSSHERSVWILNNYRSYWYLLLFWLHVREHGYTLFLVPRECVFFFFTFLSRFHLIPLLWVGLLHSFLFFLCVSTRSLQFYLFIFVLFCSFFVCTNWKLNNRFM